MSKLNNNNKNFNYNNNNKSNFLIGYRLSPIGYIVNMGWEHTVQKCHYFYRFLKHWLQIKKTKINETIIIT